MGFPLQNFYEAIENNARFRPRKSVLFIDKQQVSNRKLKRRIDVFASYLKQLGIKKGDRVALIVENSEEYIISIFAITKLGAIVVPVNTFLKHEEFEFILNDCGASLLISSAKFAKETKSLPQITKIEKIIWVGEYEDEDEDNFSFSKIIKNQKFIEDDDDRPSLDDIACIVYTSGTTGKPKGAMLSYRNIFSNVFYGGELFKITQKDRFIVYLPMFHVFTFTIMLIMPICRGSSIIIVKSVFPFSNVIKQTLLKRATIFLGVPTIFNAMNKAKIPWYFMWFNKIRIFLSGSAPLNEVVLNDFSKKFKRATLLESYGLSECSPGVAANTLERQKPYSVGLPLKEFDVKIVDDEMLELKPGEVGEIIVKGECVMQGYYGRADATDETIVNGWLRTGDLGKKDEDGFLYIVDRKKDLIISKGINIYPREIEEAIMKYEGIDSVAVVGQADETSDEDVVAFIQLKDEVESISEKDLKKYLKLHLANFKIPKHIYVVEELPKNATGKVLKRVLKEELSKGDFLQTKPQQEKPLEDKEEKEPIKNQEDSNEEDKQDQAQDKQTKENLDAKKADGLVD
ncbi:MAG: long-chain fatty acid--CoA ligase [Proteobacteria bacterium]|nr:MAG: long-chain fatty acid--CoA ligase [Pseudomonadota bacterium]